jgi:hypothetical protein
MYNPDTPYVQLSLTQPSLTYLTAGSNQDQYIWNTFCVYACASGILQNATHCALNSYDAKILTGTPPAAMTYPIPCIGYMEFDRAAVLPTQAYPAYLQGNSDKT